MGPRGSAYSVLQWMPRQEKTPKKKSKKKSPQKSEESEYPAMDQAEMNRLIQNAVEHVQAELQQKHEERIKALEAEHMVTVLINDPASVPACDVTYLVEGHLMDARAQGE